MYSGELDICPISLMKKFEQETFLFVVAQALCGLNLLDREAIFQFVLEGSGFRLELTLVSMAISLAGSR